MVFSDEPADDSGYPPMTVIGVKKVGDDRIPYAIIGHGDSLVINVPMLMEWCASSNCAHYFAFEGPAVFSGFSAMVLKRDFELEILADENDVCVAS